MSYALWYANTPVFTWQPVHAVASLVHQHKRVNWHYRVMIIQNGPAAGLLACLLIYDCHARVLPVHRAPDAGPLWSIDGPQIKDIAQTEVPDCWFAAALCACVHSSPKFITDRLLLTGGPDLYNAKSVRVTVFNESLLRTPQVVSYKDVMAVPTDMAGENWWPGAWQLATLQMGYPGMVGKKFGAATAEVGLGIVSGYKGVLETNLKPDEMWDMLTHAPISPVLVGSNAETTILKKGHTYVAMSTRLMSNGTRAVTLHNPFGKTAEYIYAHVFPDISQIGHLNKWQKFGDK